jgi:multisubunit Na+/H+ antiporter MnhE subunit
VKARRLLSALAWWPLLFGVWVLLITVRSPAELLIGVGFAGIATAGVEAARRAGVVRFRPRPSWLLPFVQVPYRIVTETATVFATLPGTVRRGAPSTQRLRAIAFEGGAAYDARSQARRALALWLASSSPNTIALGVDIDADVLVVHELSASERMPTGTDLADR